MGILDAPTPLRNGRMVPNRRRGGSILPAPPIASTNIQFTETVAAGASGVTWVTSYKVAADATDIQLVYPGWVGASGTTPREGPLSASIPVKASVEINSNGTRHPVTFAAARTSTLDSFGVLTSNPLAVTLAKGDVVTVRTNMSTASGNYPKGMSTGGGPGYDTSATDGFATYGDATDAGGLSQASVARSLAPILCGQPVNYAPAIFGLGDSITWGQADVNNNYSWFTRALVNNFGAVRVAIQGLSAQDVAASITKMPRMGSIAAACTSAVVMLGANDVLTRTFAQAQADLLAVWTALANRGLAVFACTLPPRSTTSTDSWMTASGQTAAGTDSVRTQINDWIRTKPAPLTGYFDTADAVEVNAANALTRNGGLWIAPSAAAASIASASLTSNVVTVTTAAAHGLYVGATVVVQSVGAPFDGTYAVASVPSTTTFTYAKTAANTSVGAGGSVWLPYTVDGTHPHSTANVLMAAKIDTSKFAA